MEQIRERYLYHDQMRYLCVLRDRVNITTHRHHMKQSHGLNLSISLSPGKETKKDSLSSGE